MYSSSIVLFCMLLMVLALLDLLRRIGVLFGLVEGS